MNLICHNTKHVPFSYPENFYTRIPSIYSIPASKQFRKEEFSEPSQKSARWKPVDEKVLWELECQKLKTACLIFKHQGIKTKKLTLIRNWFMVELGLFTGLRVMEMTNVEIKDLVIQGEHSTVVVRKGKGGKRRDIWINSEFKKICSEFLRLREKFGFSNTPDNNLLVSAKGLPLTTRALEKAFKKCAAEAGLSSSYSIHCLRHTYATFSLDAGVDIRFLKEQMGHASIKTTELYLSLLQEKNRLALEKLYKTAKSNIKK
jgi:site-specific recombinase XerD